VLKRYLKFKRKSSELLQILNRGIPVGKFQEHANNEAIFPVYILNNIIYSSNKYLYTTNNGIHKYNTRNNNNLLPALTNLTKYNKGSYVPGIKVFNHLPQYLKASDLNSLHIRSSLKRFLYHHSFYCMEEYYGYKENTL